MVTIRYGIKTEGLDKIVAAFSSAPKKVSAEVNRWAESVADDERDLIRGRTPYKTGALRESIRKYKIGDGAWEIRSSAKRRDGRSLASTIEFGTGGPGRRIYPRTAKVLAFRSPQAALYRGGGKGRIVGGMVFRRWVRGFNGFYMFARGSKDMAAQMPKRLKELQARIMAIMGGR